MIDDRLRAIEKDLPFNLVNRSILIFPEETRSEDGELLPFKKGGFLLAHATGFPILPMGIWGTAAILSKNAKDPFEPKANRVFGPIPREIVELGYQKIGSMAPEVV